MAIIYNDSFPDNIEYWGTLFNVNLGAIVNVVNGGQGKPIKYTLTEPTEGAQQQILALEVNNIEYLGNASGTRSNNQPFTLLNRFPNAPTDDIVEGAFFVRQNTKYKVRVNEESFGTGILGAWTWQSDRFPFGFMYIDSDDVIHTVAFDSVIRDSYNASWHEWWGDYTQAVNFEGLVGYDYIKNSQIVIKVPYKMFKSEEGARKFLKYGDDSDDANKGGDEIAERNASDLYLKSTVYRSINSTRTGKTKVEEHEWRFTVEHYDNDGNEIDKWNRTVIGFVRDGQSGHYNLAFLNNPNKKISKITLDGVEQDITGFSWLTPVTTYTENKEDTIQDQTYYYWSDINTNMYIFDTLAHAQDALEGLMDGLVKTFQGDDLVKTTLNDNNLAFDTDMSDVFVLDQSDVQALARRFNAQVDVQGNLFADLFVGLSMHQNPIDCSIDLFEIPIDITAFCTTSNYHVRFSPSVTPGPEENNPTA